MLLFQFFVIECDVELANIVLASLTLYVYQMTHVPELAAITTFGGWLLETFLTLLLEIFNDSLCVAWMLHYEKMSLSSDILLRSHRITLTLFIMVGVTVVVRFTSPYAVWEAAGIKPVEYDGYVFWQWAYA
jgi:hypothetical protein